MRVLWVTTAAPDPVRGGAATHAWELLRVMARAHRITLVCTSQERELPVPLPEGVEGRQIPSSPRTPTGRGRLLWEALRGPGIEEFRAGSVNRDALARALVAEQRRAAYDVVFVWGSELAPLLTLADAPSALYVTDAYTTYCRRLIAAAPTVRHRLLYGLDAIHARRWERTRLRPAAAAAAASPVDAALLSRLSGRRVDVVPVALGEEWFAPPGVKRERDLVAIIAGLDYWPNVDGIRWFVERSWPRVAGEAPAARLIVVGRSPAPELQAVLADAGVELIPDVPDARPYYWRASAVVLPLRVGSGVKNKLLHAFACRAPVVCTPVGIEGTDAQAGRDVLVAGDAAGIAEGLIATLGDPQTAAERASSAASLAAPYRTEIAAEALEALWRRAASARSGLTAGRGTPTGGRRHTPPT